MSAPGEVCEDCGHHRDQYGLCRWCAIQPKPMSGVERLAEDMHDAYERAAAEVGWATQERSRVPWADVPEANKATMRAMILEVVAPLLDAARREGAEEALREAADDLGDAFGLSTANRDRIETWLRARAAALTDSPDNHQGDA